MEKDHYRISSEEREEVKAKFFSKSMNGVLIKLPKKEKQKLTAFHIIMERFELDRIYSEKEINNILKSVNDDFAMLRRYLIEYGFLDRKGDGSAYWVKN